MSYYSFKRKEILQKARYSPEYNFKNKVAIKEKSKNWYKNLQEEKKDKIKE